MTIPIPMPLHTRTSKSCAHKIAIAFCLVTSFCLLLWGLTPYTYAEEAQDTLKPYEKPSDVFHRSAPDWQDRVSLAQRMHEIRPASEQINNAITQMARNLPPRERPIFRTAMSGAIDYEALERFSVEAMAMTYTVLELQSMVEYHEKPEAQTAVAKVDVYIERMEPKITQMLDAAMMRIRTGEGR